MNPLLQRGVWASFGVQNVRFVSSKYLKPHPRPYKRRLFEAAVAPILPRAVPSCLSRAAREEEFLKQKEEYMPIEIALANKVREWIREEEFRVMAVCQLLPVPGRTLHFAKNQLRLKGVEFRSYGGRIMRKVFEETPFRVLDPLFRGNQPCVLCSRQLEAVKTIVNETAKIPYIVPLAITVDSRILSMAEAKELAAFASPEDLRAQTVQLLQTPAPSSRAASTTTRTTWWAPWAAFPSSFAR